MPQPRQSRTPPRPQKQKTPPLPPASPDAATSQTDAAAAANQAQRDLPPALTSAEPPQEEVVVEPYDNADFESPSPVQSPPREQPPAVEEVRSAPAVDAASTGEAAPKTSGCRPCELRVCTEHGRIPLPLGVTIHVAPPPAEAAPKDSGVKPAAPTCPRQRHPLIFEAVFTHGTCDKCGAAVATGDMIAQCRTCEPPWWGHCPACESQNRDRMKSRDPAEVPAEERVTFFRLWAGGGRDGGPSSRFGAALSEGVSADDSGRSAEGPRR